ncbi:A-factor-processing enzyme [Spathaspora sp. JA1]|nr:A-factor-processing enzyme [Spathaspora sp. JA1]
MSLVDHISSIQQGQDDKELHWLITEIISREFPQIIETLEIVYNLLTFNSPQQPDEHQRIERGPSIKLPLSSGKSEVLKGIIVRDGCEISQLQISIHEPHLNKYIHKLNLITPIKLPQIITAGESINQAITIINNLLTLFQTSYNSQDLITLFHKLLQQIEISKTSLQIPIDPNLVFPVNITPSDFFEPKLHPAIAIDFYISQAEVCLDLKCLHRIKEKPWGEIEMETGRSYIDKIRDEMKLPSNASSIVGTNSINTENTAAATAAATPLNVNDIEKRLHEMTSTTTEETGFTLKKVMGSLQLRAKHDPIDYITKCITYNSMVVMINKKIEVSSPDPILVSAFTKLDSVEYLISSYIDCLTKVNMKYTLLADDSSIEKPITDDRSYRFFKLSNDLRVLVINDPEADKSAASLDVNVGSFTDSKFKISGLAHFCEHLLFMGTEKYPLENEYSSYLSKHSGNSNAYTSSEHTNYYFQIGSNYLEGALDRFAQFFISPLFSSSCQDREINAVDSENKKNLQNDNWRLHQLDKLNTNLNHPYNGFSTGNFHTLSEEPKSRGVDVRNVLIDFYQTHYSSNLMSLVILGKEDLDTLTNWAIEKFSLIPNKQLARPNYQGELILQQQHLNKLIKAQPIMDNHQLELQFMIPDDFEDKWDSKPMGYYSHLIGHESQGSILYYLKNKGWATELSSGNMKVSQGNSFFIIEFTLTPKGFENWQEIVKLTFSYLHMIVEENEPQAWIWKELQEMSQVNFKFRQKMDVSNTVSKLSNHLYQFDEFIPANYLLNSSIYRTFDAGLINQYGKYLNADNFRVFLISKLLPGLTKTEPWYGTKYEIESVSPELLNDIKSPTTNPAFHFPIPNDFIPSNFTISKHKSAKPQISPYLLENNSRINLWYKQDDTFEVPKGTIELLFHLPNSNSDVVSNTLSSLFIELLNEDLNQITYYASLVGLKVSIYNWRDGFNFKISGYNDKLSILLTQVLEKFINFKPNKDKFEIIKFKLEKEYGNFGYGVPYGQIGTYFLQFINEKTYSFDDKLKVLQDVKFEQLQEFISSTVWKSGIFIEGLIHGNFDILQVNDIKQLVLTKTNHISSIQQYNRLENYIPKQTIRYELNLQDGDNINSCIEYYLEIDSKYRVLTDLLATIIKEPCFNQLRTKEQLGYVVFSGVRLGRTSLGFRILVQSERTSDYLEYRITEFLNQFGKYINEKLTDEDFNKFKQALTDIKLTKLKHLNEETDRLWNHIIDGYYDFEARLKHVELLKSITLDQFIQFYNGHILNNSNKIILYLKSQKFVEVPKVKLVQAAIINLSYSQGIEVDHDKIETLAKQEDYVELAKQLELPGLSNDEIASRIKSLVEQPVPTGYPSGELYTDVESFRKDHDKGGQPEPVVPLSRFYYDQSHL